MLTERRFMGLFKDLFKKQKAKKTAEQPDDDSKKMPDDLLGDDLRKMIAQSVDNYNELWNSSDIKEIWNIEDKNDFVIALYGYLSKKCSYGEKLKELSDEETVIYLCQVFEGEINNGGFNQFFYNSSGSHSLETLQALKAIGAHKTALIYEKALSVFPDSKVPKGSDAREQILERFDDKADKILNDADMDFYKYEDDLLELNYNYIITHKENIK